MAKMGLRKFYWSPLVAEPMDALPTHGAGKVIGKAVSTNMTITNAEGELYADDMLAEYVSEFVSADLTAEVDHIALPDQATLYGAKYSEDEGMESMRDDVPPYGGIGGYQVLIVNNVRKYRAWFFPKAKASLPNWTGTTKGSSISFGTEPIAMKILAPDYGPWYQVKEFDTELAADAFVQNKLGVKAWHAVNIQAQGAGTVSPGGITAVADGESLELTFSDDLLALYVNGSDVLASVADNKYTLSNVTESKNIAVIF